MLHITDLSEEKTEWNLSDTHILIPIVESNIIGDKDRVATNSVTLNSLNGSDPTEASGHTLVIGLNRNIFLQDQPGGELILIQNSDLKWKDGDESSSHIKEPNYPFPFAEEVKTQQSIEWDQNEKSVLETLIPGWKSEKNVSIVDTTKSGKFIGKNEVGNIYELTSSGGKHSELYGYEKCTNDLANTDKRLINVEDQIPKSVISCGGKAKEDTSKVIVLPGIDSYVPWVKTNTTESIIGVVQCESNLTDTQLISEIIQTTASSPSKTVLPEKSLPLKKKAKMKTTGENELNMAQITKEEVTSDELVDWKQTKRKSGKQTTRETKRKKLDKIDTLSDNESSDEEEKMKEKINTMEITEKRKYKNIFEVVDDLKKKKLIKNSHAELLTKGLEELQVDLLTELKRKMPMGSLTEENYCTALKAFGLMVYFRQPLAFYYLKKVFTANFPSLALIKDWKRRYNMERRKLCNKNYESEETSATE